jgi:hypothetical protein
MGTEGSWMKESKTVEIENDAMKITDIGEHKPAVSEDLLRSDSDLKKIHTGGSRKRMQNEGDLNG